MSLKSKSLIFLSIFFLTILLLAGCGEEGPSQTANVIGSVADISLNPISGATVVIGSSSTTTSYDGSFSLDRVQSGNVTLSVSAPGYISVTKIINVKPMTTNYIEKVILQTRDSKSTDVGSDGGIVSSTDGLISVSIPSGALSSSTSIVVTNCSLLSLPYPLPDGYKLIYLAYISPSDLSLTTPATLYIPLQSELPVYFFSFGGTSWNELGQGSESSDKISISITKFGWIAAAVKMSAYGSVTGKVLSSAGGAIAGADILTSYKIAITDSSGNYTITNLPPGSLTITASKTSYSSNSVNVIVKSSETVAASDIVLSPASTTGTINGKVLSLNSSEPIQNARIVAGAKTVYTDSLGNYSISGLGIGTVKVDVYAYGYLNETDLITIPSSGIATKTFRLQQVSVSEFYDDFETDKSWTTTGLWQRVNNSTLVKNTLSPTYVLFPAGDDGSLPSAKSGSYTYWFGKSDTGSYINEQSPSDTSLSGGTSTFPYVRGDLISPQISLVGFSTVTLSFWTWWEIEGRDPKLFDKMDLKISEDNGATWTTILSLNPDYSKTTDVEKGYSSSGFFSIPVWTKNVVDLTNYAGKNIRLCFSFDPGDVNSNGFRGWFIDDVSISKDAILPSSKK